MKHPKDIIPGHPQTVSFSCVAWATEIILLTFEQPLPANFQALSPFGFYEAGQRLKDAGISSRTRAFGKDYAGFANEAHDVLKADAFPAVVIPSYNFYYDELGEVSLINHAYLVGENGGALEFYSSDSKGQMTIYSEDRFGREYNAWIRALKTSPAHHTDHLLHTLSPIR